MIAGSSSESCKRYKSNPTEWAGERESEKEWENKKRKKNNTLKEILSNPTEWAGENERTKWKKNTLKEILSNRVGRRERKRESERTKQKRKKRNILKSIPPNGQEREKARECLPVFFC